MIYLNLLSIAVIIVLIVDVSGFNDTYKSIISNITKWSNVKGLCSLCLTWWGCILYLLITANLTLFNIALAILIACMSSIITDMFYFIKDTITLTIRHLSNKISNLID